MIDVIIQARMGSSRLPGKVLMKLNGVSVLQCLINQLDYSKSLNRKIIATSTNEEDNVIFESAKTIGVDSFRGNDLDVLDRYYQCAKYFSVQHVVRITADCPLIDPQIVDKTIEFYKNNNFDYVNNFYKKTFPSGTEVEVFSFSTLEKVWKNAKKPSEREHVTSYIYTNPEQFSIGFIEYHEDLSNLHWTVDRTEDLNFVRALYSKIHKQPILLEDILNVIKDEPLILEINKNTNPKEGYLKSLQNDNKNL